MEAKEEASNVLSQVDSIMEPDIEVQIKKFMDNGGAPSDMIKLFLKSYKGYSQLSNIVISWLQGFGLSQEEVDLIVTEQIKEKITEEIGRNRCERIFESLKVNISDDIENESRPDVVGYEKFCNSIIQQFHIVLNSATQADFETNVTSFCRMACISELGYFKTRCMVHKLNEGRNDLLLKNIISRLDAYSKQRAPTTGLNIAAMHISKNQQVRAILEDLASSGTATTTDISRIVQMDSRSVSYLQCDALFNFLIDYIFIPQEQSVPRRQLKSYVSALCSLSHGRSMEKDTQTIDLFLNLASLCQTKQFGSLLSPVPAWLLTGLSDPLFARGLVRWIHHVLSSVSYFRTTYEQAVTPLFITLLGHIASNHELLRGRIFDIVWSMLTLQFPKEFLALEVIELQRKLLPLLTHLIHLGLASVIFKHLSKNIDRVDRTILRSFITMVCDSIRPPIPREFYDALILLVQKSEWLYEDPKTKASLDDFLAAVRG